MQLWVLFIPCLYWVLLKFGILFLVINCQILRLFKKKQNLLIVVLNSVDFSSNYFRTNTFLFIISKNNYHINLTL